MFKYNNFKEQLSDYLNSTKCGEIEFAEIKNQVIYNCDLFEFLDVYDLLVENDIIKLFVNNDYEIISLKNIEIIRQTEISLNSIDFLAYLINFRFRISKIEIINLNYIVDFLDVKIIQTKGLLDDLKNNISSINEIFGVFFIYEKDKALPIFLNYFVKLLKERPENEVFPYLISKYHQFFNILGLDYIPIVNYSNYRNLTHEKYSVKSYISKIEVQKAIREKEYFSKDYPCVNINKNYLLKSEDYEDEQLVRLLISNYFSKILKEKNIFKGIEIFDIFLSNLSDQIPKYKIYELLYTKKKLKEYIEKNDGKIAFLAFFCALYESEKIVNISNKFPYLLEEYFGKEYFSASTVKQYFVSPEKRSKKFIKYLEESSKIIVNNYA